MGLTSPAPVEKAPVVVLFRRADRIFIPKALIFFATVRRIERVGSVILKRSASPKNNQYINQPVGLKFII